MSFVCVKCHLTFDFQYKLIVHVYFHKGQNNIKSDKVILSSTEDEKSICGICSKRFIYRSRYLDHIRTCVIKVPASFDCVLCDKVLHSIRCVTDHIRIHTRECPYKCDKCDKLFIRKDQYTAHKKRHENNKENEKIHKNNSKHVVDAYKNKFKCLHCTKQYTRQSHLQSHVRSHTGQLTDECELCGKFFLRSDHLQRHKVIHKLDVTNKQCSCAVCGMRCSQELLKTHMMDKHHETIKCKECGKCFKTKGNLTFHERVHYVKSNNIR